MGKINSEIFRISDVLVEAVRQNVFETSYLTEQIFITLFNFEQEMLDDDLSIKITRMLFTWFNGMDVFYAGYSCCWSAWSGVP